jgi:phospho-N-acetylmuramoyl-pentapeptide-transferase
MGDVGSLALGGALGTVSVVIKQELLLPWSEACLLSKRCP